MRKKILIVEDENVLLRQYFQVLEKFGEVLVATNSRDALSMINKNSFDLLILDNKLIGDSNFPQDIAGFCILKNVRKVLELKTPVILITGHGKIVDSIDLEAEISDLEMCLFAEKPIDIKKLERTVEDLLTSPIVFKEINNASLWNWINEKEKLQMKDYSLEKPKLEEYFSMINKLAEKYIKCSGDNDCKDLITHSKYLDWILYLTEKRYRNHFEHQFNVGAFGWYLLDVEVEKGKTLRGKILEIFEYKGEKWTEEQLNSSWWLASLLHDHAYPIAYLFEASFPMRRFLTDPSNIYRSQMRTILNSYNVVYNRILAPKFSALFVQSWERDIKDELLGEISSQLHRYDIALGNQNPYDHGILGAVNMISHLESKSIPIDSVIHEALVAIAFHNDEKINIIRIDEHPIAFLLILCDQFQEWNRVIIKNDKCLTEFDSIFLNLDRSEDGKLQFPERLKVRFEYKDETVLKETGWNYNLFVKSKREHIGRLKFTTSFNPKGLDIEVLVLNKLNNY